MKTIYAALLFSIITFSGCKKNSECASDSLIGKSLTLSPASTGLTVYASNIITPNHDALNDQFWGAAPVELWRDSISSKTVKIYCGSTLIATDNYWKGDGASDGVYRAETTFTMVNGGTVTATGYVRVYRSGTVSCQEKALYRFPGSFDNNGDYNTYSIYNEKIPCN